MKILLVKNTNDNFYYRAEISPDIYTDVPETVSDTQEEAREKMQTLLVQWKKAAKDALMWPIDAGSNPGVPVEEPFEYWAF